MGTLKTAAIERADANQIERLSHRLTEMTEARMAFVEAKDRQDITEGRLLEELIAQGRIECLTIRHSALRQILRSK